MSTDNKELRDKIANIWGLEVSPDGVPEQLLERDERGDITGGADYRNEVDSTVQLILSELSKEES